MRKSVALIAGLVYLVGRSDGKAAAAEASLHAGDSAPDEGRGKVLDRTLTWLEAHPWVVTVSVPILVAIKVLSVAGWDVGTAQVIIGAQGIAGLTSLVLMSVACLAFIIAAAFFLGAVISMWKGCKHPKKGSIAYHGWPGVFWMTIFGAIFGAILAGFSDSMWAPAERITLETQPAPVIGYVLSDDGNRAVVLLEADRTTVAYRSEEIEERQRCHLPEGRTSSEYPDCPS